MDSKLFDVARVLEFSKRKLITKLILPSALPNLLLGARLSLGVAWVSLVVAELMGSTEGIGYMIMDARQFFKYRYRICRHNYLCICWEVF